MRVGTNPQKKEKSVKLTTHHRVVVVVYIPNNEGFYSNSLNVFKTCLDSIIATTNSNAAITVVDNGSYKDVGKLLKEYYDANKIDTCISHCKNIGKIDALIGAARGAREKYITLTDADILFVNGWQIEIESVFKNFKNVGSVSPIPVRKSLYYGTSSVLLQILFGKVKYKQQAIPENFENYNKYLDSINWDRDKSNDLKWQIIEKNNCKANIGSGHQVLTITRDILFQTIPTNPSLVLVGNNSEYLYIDEAIDKSGKMRLATYHNFAYHMGNNLENWMTQVQVNNNFTQNSDSLMENQNVDLFYSNFENKLYRLKKRIIKKTFSIFEKK